MKEITLEATVYNIETVADFINEQLEAAGCPFKTRMKIDIAVEELFTNISRYAYAPASGQATVRYESGGSPPSAIITFIDSGIPFDPLSVPEPDITLSAEDRKIGGLGIYMVRKSMDCVSYEYKDGQNILRIKKYL